VNLTPRWSYWLSSILPTSLIFLLVSIMSAAPAAAAASINACVNNSSGTIHIVGPSASCAGNEVLLVWNISGTNGTNGANGTSVTVTGTVPKGDTHCSNGGLSLLDGSNGNTYYLCNGLDGTAGAPLVVGAWFGIARPCPANAASDSGDHAALCTAVCGACPNAGVLPPEVPMSLALEADGTVVEEDASQVSLYHTPAHGQWTLSAGDGLVDRPGTDRFKGTFLWLGQTPPAFGLLGNAVRTRLITYSDPLDPDSMIGIIQPYFFPIAASGLVVVNPASDPFNGNHIPTIDPLVSPLPSGCDLTKGCLGTYHFIIRRIKAE
jgi:hypothetical protein